MSVRAAADTHGLGVDQGLECRDMTGSTTRLLLMLTTPSDCLGSHMISNDWSWSESLGAKALKNGPLWPFLWVRELSGEEQLMQPFVPYNFFFFFFITKKKKYIYVQHLQLSQPSLPRALWFQVLVIWANHWRRLALKSLQCQRVCNLASSASGGLH